ncbi:MAG: carbohydrate ABC transporter permease [Caldilineaceae bacterium]
MMYNQLKTLLFHGVALLLSIAFVLPLWWVFVGALRPNGLPPPMTIEWYPWAPNWSNFTALFDLLNMTQFALNSLYVSTLGALITVFSASLAGFAMAQLPERLRQRLVLFSILMLFVPVTTLWLTRFLIFMQLGLLNTRWALLAPAVMGTSTLYVLLFYWTFRRVPVDLLDSARVEGAGAFHIWWRIGLPLARPTIVTIAILAFVHYWSDFIDPLLYLKSERYYTLSVGLNIIQQMDITNWSLMMAAAIVMVVPVLVAYFVMQYLLWSEDRLAGIYGQ